MTTSTNTSFGITVGRALGNAAAYTVHGALSAAQYTGQFGKDVAAGATAQYATKAEELKAARMAAFLKARAAREAQADITEVVAAPAKTQRKVVAAPAPAKTQRKVAVRKATA